MAGQYRILVVDDEPVTRRVMARSLTHRGHDVREAGEGASALEICEVWHPRMVISDIQMSSMDGFALLAQIKLKWPSMLRVLMTAHDIESYVQMMIEHDVGNIIPKDGSLSLAGYCDYLEALLDGEVFGLERYFGQTPVRLTTVRTAGEARQACALAVEQSRAREPLYLEMAVDELISNAVYHGVLGDTPRDQWDDQFALAAEDAVRVGWASDSEKVAVSVSDPRGRLRMRDVLRWLQTPVAHSRGDVEHGRGLLLVHKLIDRLIVNIQPQVTTECIVFQYKCPTADIARRPLLVHEL